MFFERGGHEFFARENAVPGKLQLRMILWVDPVHKFASALADNLPVAPRRSLSQHEPGMRVCDEAIPPVRVP